MKTIALKILKSLMTESFVKKLVIYLLEYLAKKTDNEVDDKIVGMVKEAVNA